LLPNGLVLVAGGFNGSSLASAELYNPANGTWTTTGSLGTARVNHRATLLPNGLVLVAGGYNGSYLTSAELYNVGLGFNASWQPQIASVNSPLSLGGNLTLTGSQFRGISEGSCGNTQDSPTDYPVVQLRSLGNEQTEFLVPTSWSGNSFSSVPVSGVPPGYALVTVFVNGIPSPAQVLSIDLSGLHITGIAREGNDILISWQTMGGVTNQVQVTSGGVGGSYSNNFSNLTGTFVLPGNGLTNTDYLDTGGATHGPARYYRIQFSVPSQLM
jgi:hypothetical protein